MFRGISGREHRSTLASSVVARGPIFRGISGVEHRSTLASSVVARRPIFWRYFWS